MTGRVVRPREEKRVQDGQRRLLRDGVKGEERDRGRGSDVRSRSERKGHSVPGSDLEKGRLPPDTRRSVSRD